MSKTVINNRLVSTNIENEKINLRSVTSRLISTKKDTNKTLIEIVPFLSRDLNLSRKKVVEEFLKDYKDLLPFDQPRQLKVINYTGASITPAVTWSRHPLSTIFKVNKNVKKINCRWTFPIMWVDSHAIMHFIIVVNNKEYARFTEAGYYKEHFVKYDLDIDNITDEYLDIELRCRNFGNSNRFAMFCTRYWNGANGDVNPGGQLVITEIPV